MLESAAVESTRTTYDVVAADYARLLPDASAEAPADLELIRDLARATPVGARILDAGCGTGRMIGHLESPGQRVVEGVDLSPGMIAVARTNRPTTRFTVADLAALPFPDGSFDAALAWYSIIHTAAEDLPGVIAEFHRVVSPGGRVLLGFHAGHGARTIQSAYGHDVELEAHLHDVEDIRRLLAGQGFQVRKARQRPPSGREQHPQGFVLAQRR